MKIRTIVVGAAVALLASCGCKKSPTTSAPPPTHVPGALRTDEVLTAWRNAGLSPEGFAPLVPTPNGAGYCEHGTVGGVDTVVCEYTTDEAVATGIKLTKEGWARVDAHTAVILQARRTTMAVVDRERREPSGKTINLMASTFRRLQ